MSLMMRQLGSVSALMLSGRVRCIVPLASLSRDERPAVLQFFVSVLEEKRRLR